MSIGLFLLHIAVARYHKAIFLTVIIVTEVFGIVYLFLFIFQCQPSSYFWSQFAGNGATGKCLPANIIVNATYVYSAISCWGDWTMSIVPMFMIQRLQLPARTKLVVIGILGLGGMWVSPSLGQYPSSWSCNYGTNYSGLYSASTATIVRFPYVPDLANKSDFLYSTTDVAIWSTAETGLGITASAFITLRPLFRKFLGRSQGSGAPANSSGPTPGNGDFPRERARSPNPRSMFRSHLEEFKLRSDVGRHSGLTTIIKSGGNLGTNVGGRKGNGKNGTLWNNDATWNTSESQLACDNTCEEIGHTSSIGSTGPERDHELRIEVNRAVVVQSSISNSPAEMPTSAELQYAGVSPPSQVHQPRRD